VVQAEIFMIDMLAILDLKTMLWFDPATGRCDSAVRCNTTFDAFLPHSALIMVGIGQRHAIFRNESQITDDIIERARKRYEFGAGYTAFAAIASWASSRYVCDVVAWRAASAAQKKQVAGLLSLPREDWEGAWDTWDALGEKVRSPDKTPVPDSRFLTDEEAMVLKLVGIRVFDLHDYRGL
jgi:hypothetical protein